MTTFESSAISKGYQTTTTEAARAARAQEARQRERLTLLGGVLVELLTMLIWAVVALKK